MNARDELAEIITSYYRAKSGLPPLDVLPELPTHAKVDEPLADAILAAGYRKSRTITTDEEMAEAPKGIVVRELDGLIWEKQGDGEGGAFWVETGDDQEYEYTEISLPATVLYEPEPQP